MTPQPRIRKIASQALESVQAHDGEGLIRFGRVFDRADFVGPWDFVDYAELPPGTSIGVHTHGRNEELYFVIEGRGSMHLDGRDYPVEPGTLILNRACGTHGLRNNSTDRIRLLVIQVRLPGDSP